MQVFVGHNVHGSSFSAVCPPYLSPTRFYNTLKEMTVVSEDDVGDEDNGGRRSVGAGRRHRHDNNAEMTMMGKVSVVEYS